ncbi:MAG: Gfo/Idh/MocA family oxidoreductase [Brumimicrobium sp.]|nr:Gfo/Idh/MocA family oxidoreductase [Brumimicrobium sp.]
MEKIRIGIVGTANIATRSVIPEIINLDDKFHLAGIASRDGKKAEKYAAQFSTVAFPSYDALLNSKQCDAVYIPLPNALHYPYAKKALLNNLHVLVEKPLATDPDQVADLIDTARERNLLLMENFQFRFHSQLQYLIQSLRNGVIGELRALNAAFCFPPFPDSDNIRYRKDLEGGALLDAGAYTAKISSIILGNDITVKAASLHINQEKMVDTWGSAFLKDTNSSLTASLTFGFDNFYQCGIRALGSKGLLTTNRLFTAREDHVPVFELEINGKPKEVIKLKPDNHFKHMLETFHGNISDDDAKEREHTANLLQSSLLAAIKKKANA